jgi:hypothetical protein
MRRFLKTAAKILGLAFGVIVLTMAIAYAAGTVWIDVRETRPGGHRVVLAVPSVLVTLGLRFVPDKDLRDDSDDWRPWLPTIAVAGRELERCPDARLVEVKGPGQWVSITKRGQSLVIDVEDETDNVHISLPVGLVPSVASELANRHGPN